MSDRRPGSVLIDASNLRSGGAVQVAASFLDELAQLKHPVDDEDRYLWLREGLTVHASPAVVDNMTMDPRDLHIKVGDRHWTDARIWRPGPPGHDVSFVVFGPEYGWSRAQHRIVGFADGVSLYPGALKTVHGTQRIRWLLRAWMSRRLFGRADKIIVEAPHVRAALHGRWRLPAETVTVVPNVLNGVFSDPSRWADSVAPDTDPEVHLVCYVARAYAHKNHDILGTVGSILATRYGLDVRFLVTLTEGEWATRTTEFRATAVNVGPVAVDQLPQLYRSCVASVFPSLIESFSVTPLEAMAAGCPLAASDRAFVRDVADDGALYFEPTDPGQIAAQLALLISQPRLRAVQRERGLRRVSSWPTSADRSRAYADLITHALVEVERTRTGR